MKGPLSEGGGAHREDHLSIVVHHLYLHIRVLGRAFVLHMPRALSTRYHSTAQHSQQTTDSGIESVLRIIFTNGLLAKPCSQFGKYLVMYPITTPHTPG